MTERDWDGERSHRDRLVGLVVLAGLGVSVLVVGCFLVVHHLVPESYFRRGRAIQPTVLTLENFPVWGASFTDVAGAAGVTAVQATGAAGERLLPETMGSGVVLGDLDDDGDDDLLLLSVGSTPTLYRNDSPRGGPIRFTDVTEGSGLESIPETTTAAVGDHDGDGRVDLLVGTLGPDRLLRNLGELRFETVRELGDGWTSAAGFADIDGDTDLDLVVLSYVEWSPAIDREVDYTLDGIGRAYGPPTGFKGTNLALWINGGDGTFQEESARRGLRATGTSSETSNLPPAPMKGLGLLLQDIVPHRPDGAVDVFVANDTTPNRLFRNDGTGNFSEVGLDEGLAYDLDGRSTGAMGVDIARSLGNDDYTVIAIGNFSNEPSSLHRRMDYRWSDAEVFSDISLSSGVGAPTRPSLTFGTLLVDLDLDGEVDLLQVNGHLEPEIGRVQSGQDYRQRAQIFRNTGGEPLFLEVPAEQLGDLARPVVGRAAATADLDRDGDPDLVISHLDSVPLVLRNDLDDTGMRNCRIRIKGPAGNPHGIGTMVTVYANGGFRQMVARTRSYLAQSSPVLLFPVPAEDATLDVLLELPDGRTIRHSEVPVQDEMTFRLPD